MVATVFLGFLSGCAGTGGKGRGSGPTSNGDPAHVKVFATTAIWADVVEQVACGRLDVPSLIPAGVDAHDFEPTVQDVDRLLSAELVVLNGLNLESHFGDILASADARGVRSVALAPKVDPIAEDPHVWMDPDRVALAVPVIFENLREVEDLGIDEAALRTCAERYLDELRTLSESMDEELAAVPVAARKLVTNHKNLAYFADRFDFKVVGEIIPSTSSLGEADPRTFDELAAKMKSAGIETIFVDAVGTRGLADVLAERVGRDVRVEQLFVESPGRGPQTDTYLKMMSTNATRIARSLSR